MEDSVDKTCFRWRDFVMTERDELAFSRVLHEFVPGVLFYDAGGRAASRSRRIECISNASEWQVFIAIPSPMQMTEWSVNLSADYIVVRPALYGHFHRSRWEWPDPTKKWAFDPPLLGWGNVSIGFPCEEDDLRRYADQIVRKLAKVTTHGSLRLGLDACRWSQAGGIERRGLGSGFLIDPSEKIELNKYYDDSLWDDGLKAGPIECQTNS